MNNELFIAVSAGLGGMLGWGFADFFAKKAVDIVGPIRSLVWAQFFGTVFFLAVAVVHALTSHHSLAWPDNVSSWFGLVFFGILQMLVYWFAYQGFEKGQLAVLNPVFASYSGIVALLAVILFGNSLSLALAISLILIFVGNMILNVDLKGLRSKQLKVAPGLKEVAIAALLAAGWTLGWDKFVAGRDALSSALFMFAFMSISAFVLAKAMKVALSEVKGPSLKFIVFMGMGEAIAYLAISWGFSSTSLTGLIALISGAFSVPAVILAYAFLKERITKLQMAAIFIIVTGIIFAALS